MSLVKKTYQNSIPSIFEDLFKADWFGGTTTPTNRIGISSPAVNIEESDQDFTLYLAAPGLIKEDFNLELDNDVLSISVNVKSDDEKKDETVRFTRREFNYGTFERTFGLPDTIDSTEIKASYENGVLIVSLPKKEEAKIQAKRSIEIS